MDVSIILVNYNTKQLTLDCIDTIYKYTEGLSFEIIIVDNHSSDGSIEVLSHDERVRFFDSGDNLGFGLANNLGVEKATGKYVFLLNTDTLLTYNVIKVLYDYMESHQLVGVVGVGLLDAEGNNNAAYVKFPSVCHTFRLCLQYFERHCGLKSKSKQLEIFGNEVDVDGVTGADMFVRKELFDEAGGFDKDIFMYGEEVELQYRIAELRYRRVLLPGEHIIHLEGGSSPSERKNRLSFFVLYSMLRGKCIFYRKHKNAVYRLVALLLELPVDAVFILMSPYRKYWSKYINNYKILRRGYKIPEQIKDKEYYQVS